MSLFAPKTYPIRKPTDKNNQVGGILNPPNFTEVGGIGGLTSASKIAAKSKIHKMKKG